MFYIFHNVTIFSCVVYLNCVINCVQYQYLFVIILLYMLCWFLCMCYVMLKLLCIYAWCYTQYIFKVKSQVRDPARGAKQRFCAIVQPQISANIFDQLSQLISKSIYDACTGVLAIGSPKVNKFMFTLADPKHENLLAEIYIIYHST